MRARNPRPLKSAAFFLLLLPLSLACTPLARAEDRGALIPLKLTARNEGSNSQLSAGLEGSVVSTGGTQVNGLGLRLSYEYAFNDQWSIHPDLSLVFSTSSAQGFSYSGVDGFFRYNFLGSLRSTQSSVWDQGNPIAVESSLRSNRLSLGVGVLQLFLNGAKQVYPAAGLGAEVAYSFSGLGQWVEGSLRGASLTSNNKPVTVLFLGFSVLFNL